MIIKVCFQENVSDIEFDPNEGFETLRFQLVSLFDLDETSLLVVDFLGREVRLINNFLVVFLMTLTMTKLTGILRILTMSR